MKDKKIKAIREAVCANRGGLSEATDGQIMVIWNSLPPNVQKQYFDSVKDKESPSTTLRAGKEKSDAVSDPSKRNL